MFVGNYESEEFENGCFHVTLLVAGSFVTFQVEYATFESFFAYLHGRFGDNYTIGIMAILEISSDLAEELRGAFEARDNLYQG